MKVKRLRQLFLLFLSVGIFYACLDNNDWFDSREQLSPQVLAAKAWLESQVEWGYYIPWHTASGDDNLLIPIWPHSFSNYDSAYWVTEIDLMAEIGMLQISSEAGRRFSETGDERYWASRTRLIVRTCRETGVKSGFVMVVYPHIEYLEQNLDNPLRHFSFLHRNSDFSGFVHYYNLDGEHIGGYWQRNEEFFGVIPEDVLAENPQLRSGTCHFDCRWVQYFFYVYTNGELTHRAPCGPPFWECRLLFCEPGATPGPPPCQVGGGGSGGFSPSRDTPLAYRLVRNGLTGTEWRNLERMLQEMIKDCMGQELYNQLTGFGQKFTFQFVQGMGSSINWQTSTVSLGRDVSGNVALFHEMFHLYQMQVHGSSNWNANSMNREIETWFAEYIFVRRGHAGGNQEHLNWFYDDDFGRAFVDLGNFATLDGRIRLGENTMATEWIQNNIRDQFRNHHWEAYRRLTFNASLSPQRMFENIQRLSINC